MVVPFVALVNNIVSRGHGSGLTCKEWLGPGLLRLMPQLLVVSTNQAVDSIFLHFVKGLE